VRIATWNIQWAGPRSRRAGPIVTRLEEIDADVLVITEGQLGLMPPGHVIDAGCDWGYGEKRERRKVLGWSRRPWRDEYRSEKGAARGRLFAAVTDTDGGPVRVIAVCIPWRDAHVRTGRGGAKLWQEHLKFCTQLSAIRQSLDSGVPTILAGDFNQRIPRTTQPPSVAAGLEAAIDGLRVWTKGDTEHGRLIDHIAGDERLEKDRVRVWSGIDAGGPLSDHNGVACDVRVA